MAASLRRAGNLARIAKVTQDVTLKAAVQRRVCSVQDHPAFLRSHVPVFSTSFLHTSSIFESQSSSPITVTEEPDTLLQKLTVLVKGHDKAVLNSYEFFATLAAKELGLTLDKVFEPPKNIERLTLLKSVHIFKKHRVQYEMRTHYRCIEITRITGSTAHVYLEYIQRNLPEGVAMKVTKTAIEKVPEHIQTPMWEKESQPEQASQ
ncbi:small ribosomal subunit protein uS10m [Trichomycterus rosablanca]|uniref:small ribosomal subunit protein uS10m n=1 Tax=Trichomycterus rosablanca TaxID=2290929 RepID=UPI002F351765